MTMTNRDRVGQGLEHLARGLKSFVDTRMTAAVPRGQNWLEVLQARDSSRFGSARRYSVTDARFLLRVLTEERRAFKDHLSRAMQSFASELRETGNSWAHGDDFSGADTYRALDTMERLLTAVGAGEHAARVRELRRGLRLADDETAAQAAEAPAGRSVGTAEGRVPSVAVPQPAEAGRSRGSDDPEMRHPDERPVPLPEARPASAGAPARAPAASSAGSVTPAAHMSLSPREALRAIDPQRALLVITCSGRQQAGGHPPQADQGTQWPRELRDARARVLPSANLDASGVMPAWLRYAGTFYQHARPALEDAVKRGRVVIISGGYGIVRAEELIGRYDRKLDLADWPVGVLETALITEAHRRGADTMVAFTPATTGHARLLRRAPWLRTGITARLVTVTEVPGEAMAGVPARLGSAFGAFWNGQDDYPPGTVVENLS